MYVSNDFIMSESCN